MNKLVYAEPTNQAAKDLLADIFEQMGYQKESPSVRNSFLAIRLNAKKAQGTKFTINLVTPDNGEKFVVEMSNATLTSIKGVEAKNPDITLTVNRAELETVMMSKATFDDLVASGKAKFDGNRKPFDQLRDSLVQFTPDFEMMPGTRPAKAATPSAKGPFEQPELTRSDGG